MKNITVLLFVFLSILTVSCSEKNTYKPGMDVTDAADKWRYATPQGMLPDAEIADNVDILLTNRFPIWRDAIGAAVDISIKNKSKFHIGARGLAHLFVYSYDDKQPLFWSNIDIALGAPAQPGMMSVFSLPVGTSKDFSVAILESTWDAVTSQAWPDKSFYATIPTGQYLMRFEFELYDENNNHLGTLLSNFIRFSTVQSAPDTIQPHGEQ